MKNTVMQKVRSTMIAVMLATGLFSNSSAGQTLEDNQAKFHQRCEELKQDQAKIKEAAQSPNVSREQKERATKATAALEKVITATEAMLKDPALKTSPEKREAIFAKAQSAIIYGNAVASTTEKQLGVPRSSITDHVIAANVNIDGLLTQVSRFDGSPAPNWTTGDKGFKGSGVGNAYFGIGANPSTPVSVTATYRATTPQAAEENKKMYGSAGGGILLEDAAGGLGRISAVEYDGRYNALVMDNHLVYFMKVPSWDAAALCRDIAQDKKMRVGVSMGKTSLVYGERSTYENAGVGHNLLLADHFLGDFVFGWLEWSKGYSFPDRYEPRTAEVTSDMLVQFVFKDFQFTTKDNGLQPANLAVDVRFMPVSKKPAPDGGMLPDLDALKRGYEPPKGFLENAQYLTAHFDFFRRERIVAKTIAYGELAALFRSYKQAGVNLGALASELERG